MSSKYQPIIDPNGNLFDGFAIHGVKLVNSGVLLTNEVGRPIHHIDVTDPARKELIRDECVKLVQHLHRKEPYTPTWPDA